MDYKRILTVQDLSCMGQCSLTVALPVLSACGHETVILPSAVLSTHTEFDGFHSTDLTSNIPNIVSHWRNQNIKFDAVYSGYLGSIEEIEYVANIYDTMRKDGAPAICDPAMGDNGELFALFDTEYAHAMAGLCAKADIVLPNITEACFMTGVEYKDTYDETYIKNLLSALNTAGMSTVVLTGVSYEEGTTGIVISENGNYSYYRHEKHGKRSPGTGDVFASVFTGAYLRGHSLYESAKIAGDYVLKCIKITSKEPDHWYGVKFEPLLGELIAEL